jgi:hypothetical protein
MKPLIPANWQTWIAAAVAVALVAMLVVRLLG